MHRPYEPEQSRTVFIGKCQIFELDEYLGTQSYSRSLLPVFEVLSFLMLDLEYLGVEAGKPLLAFLRYFEIANAIPDVVVHHIPEKAGIIFT